MSASCHQVVPRFGALDTPPAPVAHGFEWALFLVGATVEGLLLARMPQSILQLTGVRREAHWQPAGATPHVHATVHGSVPVQTL